MRKKENRFSRISVSARRCVCVSSLALAGRSTSGSYVGLTARGRVSPCLCFQPSLRDLRVIIYRLWSGFGVALECVVRGWRWSLQCGVFTAACVVVGVAGRARADVYVLGGKTSLVR